MFLWNCTVRDLARIDLNTYAKNPVKESKLSISLCTGNETIIDNNKCNIFKWYLPFFQTMA